MPTDAPRHLIIEDDAVHAALVDAARHWPEVADRPSALLLRLISEGHDALLRETAQARRAAVEATAGAGTGAYATTPLAALREEWPTG